MLGHRLAASCEAPAEAQQDRAIITPQMRGWTLRSHHLLGGVPEPTRDHGPLSVVVREAFVMGHYDDRKAAAWVSYYWDRDLYERAKAEEFTSRHYPKDHELPTSHEPNRTLEHVGGDEDQRVVLSSRLPVAVSQAV